MGQLTAGYGIRVFNGLGYVFVAFLDVVTEFGSLVERAHDVLHVMSLPVNEAAKVEDHTSGLVTLAENGGVCVPESGEFFFVALALSFELFSNILLEDKRLESIVALLLRAVKALGKAGSVIFLLLDKRCEATVFALMSLDLDFELLCLFSKLFGESLELEELPMLLVSSHAHL